MCKDHNNVRTHYTKFPFYMSDFCPTIKYKSILFLLLIHLFNKVTKLKKKKKNLPQGSRQKHCSNIFIYSEDKIISTKTTKFAIEKRSTIFKNGMSCLAIRSKNWKGDDYTKIQHLTALWRSAVPLIQSKTIKPSDRQ